MVKAVKIGGLILVSLLVLFVGYIFWLQFQEYRSMEKNLLLFEEEISDWQLTRESTYYYPFYPISDIVSYVYAEYSFPADLQIEESMVREKFDINHGWEDVGLLDSEKYALRCYDNNRDYIHQNLRIIFTTIGIRESKLTIRINGVPAKSSGILPLVIYETPCFP